MTEEEFYTDILHFFEDIDKYYGSKTEITEGICNSFGDFSADLSTWNLFEFDLIRSAYRKTGDRFIMEGESMVLRNCRRFHRILHTIRKKQI